MPRSGEHRYGEGSHPQPCSFAMANMTSIPYRKRNAITPGIDSGVRTRIVRVVLFEPQERGEVSNLLPFLPRPKSFAR